MLGAALGTKWGAVLGTVLRTVLGTGLGPQLQDEPTWPGASDRSRTGHEATECHGAPRRDVGRAKKAL